MHKQFIIKKKQTLAAQTGHMLAWSDHWRKGKGDDFKLFPAYCLAMEGKSETTAGHLNTFKINALERIKY